MKRVIRVFPRKTSYTPTDAYAFVGRPPFRAMIPEHDEVHISCTFTWDKEICRGLAEDWRLATEKPVKLGGVAFGSRVEGFVPGMYIRHGFTFTTRGCDNGCAFCIVPKQEGKLVELPIAPGNIIQDNNFLQASRTHKDRVFEMLRSQKSVCFRGGLPASLIDAHFISGIQSLRISELWTACDSAGALGKTVDAIKRLNAAGFVRGKVSCYVLVGDDMDENENRCREIYKAGAMPRAQLFRDFGETKTMYTQDWRRFASMWQRPAATKAHMGQGTDWRDF